MLSQSCPAGYIADCVCKCVNGVPTCAGRCSAEEEEEEEEEEGQG